MYYVYSTRELIYVCMPVRMFVFTYICMRSLGVINIFCKPGL
jgi:hypothetical protein